MHDIGNNKKRSPSLTNNMIVTIEHSIQGNIYDVGCFESGDLNCFALANNIVRALYEVYNFTL